jgi:hypothetical protein
MVLPDAKPAAGTSNALIYSTTAGSGSGTTADPYILGGSFAQVRLASDVFTESFVVKNPVNADDFLLLKAPAALTLTALNCVAQGGGSIDVAIYECDGNGANCASGGGIGLTADGNNDADTSFTDAAIDSGDWLQVVLSAPTGTVTFISCTLSYTR